MSKIYPRLERKKLRKIEAGKKPYKTLDDKTMYTFLFEKGMAQAGQPSEFILNHLGEFTGIDMPGKVSNGYDDDYWDDDDDEYGDQTAIATLSGGVGRSLKPAEKPEFDNVIFSLKEMISLHEAYIDGKLEQVFAKMVEDKATGRPTRTYTARAKAVVQEDELKSSLTKAKVTELRNNVAYNYAVQAGMAMRANLNF